MARPPAGLCDPCAHQRLVRNTRGSSFSLCERSRTDPALPALSRACRCTSVRAGYEPREPGGRRERSVARDAQASTGAGAPRRARARRRSPRPPARSRPPRAVLRPWPSTTRPTSAATAGSRLISTPKVALRQPPQRLELQRVGDRRAEHGDREPDRQEPGPSSSPPPPSTPDREQERRPRRPSPAPGPGRRRTLCPTRAASTM